MDYVGWIVGRCGVWGCELLMGVLGAVGLAEVWCVGSWFVSRFSYVIVVLVGWFTGVVLCYVMLGWLLD